MAFSQITYLQIIIQKGLKKVTKILQVSDKNFASELDLKTQNVQSKLEIFTKLKKRRILSSLVFLIMKTKKNIQTMYQKILLKNMLLYY